MEVPAYNFHFQFNMVYGNELESCVIIIHLHDIVLGRKLFWCPEFFLFLRFPAYNHNIEEVIVLQGLNNLAQNKRSSMMMNFLYDLNPTLQDKVHTIHHLQDFSAI